MVAIRILLVEDDEHDWLAFRRVFQKSQVTSEITRYARAEEALERLLANASSFDLVVADYKLPGMSGLELCQELLDHEVPLPLVLLTGAGTEHLAVEALKAGVDDYIIKDPRQGYLELLPLVLPDVVRKHGDRLARQQAEEALRESEERYRVSIESAPYGVVVADQNEKFLILNPQWEKITGYSKGEIPDVQTWFEKAYPDEEYRRLVIEAHKTITLEEHPRIREAVIARKDGEKRICQFVSNLSPSGIRTVFINDITERKQAEERLQRYATELERSNQELQQFAYVASHDLQEPLRVVTNYLRLLEQQYEGKLDADADEFIAHAVEGATRMQTMIQDLLAYSQVGVWGVEFEPTDCQAVLDRTLTDLQVTIEESDAVVTSDPLPTVMADELQLGQVFQNLIGNAIKFRGEEPPRVHVSAQQEGDEWIFSVRDNGIGIDPEYADSIFEIFQRLHTWEEYPGTGIGLAICKKIVERHGGRIWVESQPGEGSTFYFTIKSET